jgi:hypothetical protein
LRIDGDTVKWRTGREEYANRGIVGIDPDGQISGGYDGGFAHSDEEPMTNSERAELAAYMIILWESFAKKGGTN